jgi:hypothetical protein
MLELVVSSINMDIPCRRGAFLKPSKDKGQYDDEREIFWASGACFSSEAMFTKNYTGLMMIFCPSGGNRSVLACYK